MTDTPAPKVSDELEEWLGADEPRTLGNLVATFRPRSFALTFVLLMALPALPLPTGGATHVLEVVTMLAALQLVVGRRCIWLPRRWQQIQLAGPSRQKLLTALLRRIRWFERFSRLIYSRPTGPDDHQASAAVWQRVTSLARSCRPFRCIPDGRSPNEAHHLRGHRRAHAAPRQRNGPGQQPRQAA